MSITIYMPTQEVVSLLSTEQLPADVIGSMKVDRFGGEKRTPLYDLDNVRQFIKKNRPASAAIESSVKKEGLNVNDFSGQVVDGPLLRTKQAAQYLAIGERQLQYEVCRGNVRCVRFGKNCIRFAQADLDEYVNRHRTASRVAGGDSKWRA